MADSHAVVKVGETFDALVAFTDIAKFDSYARDQEPAETAHFIPSYAEIHDRILGPSPGCVIKYIGDASMIVFPGAEADAGVRVLLELHQTLGKELSTPEFSASLHCGAHYGQLYGVELPPFNAPDVLGSAANIERKGRGQVVISTEAFRKLGADTRKLFRRHREPEVYLSV